MRIATLRIENFRSFRDETIHFNNYSCFVGSNGAGKSTVLTALNVFFRLSDGHPTDLRELDEEDFHYKETDNPIKITVTFKDLSQEAKNDLSDYVRQGQLVVSAVAEFDQTTKKAVVKQIGQRLGIKAFARFFQASKDGKRVADLKVIYNELKNTYEKLPASGTKDAMSNALNVYEADNPNECELIPSEDQFCGFKRGTNRLSRHVHWVYVPAVKDATSEQVEEKNSALGKLLAWAVRTKVNFDESIKKLREETQDSYQDLLAENQDTLNEISTSLNNRLSEWAHPEASLKLQWKQDLNKSIRVEEPWAHIVAGEGEFKGQLARFGHGLQRSYLLALLQELSFIEDGMDTKLIFACEEPELYQHPPQSRHLAYVLNELSRKGCQVIVSTHNPGFVSGEGFEDVRMVRKEPISSVYSLSFEKYSKIVSNVTDEQPIQSNATLAKIHQTLQPTLNEMFFTRKLILVEGLEDVAYLQTYFNLLNLSDRFRSLGCHIVPTNGKSELLRPLVISNLMKIPTYLIFDSDADKPDKNGSRKKHSNDNSALLKLVGGDEKTPFPNDTICGAGYTAWYSDITTIVKNEITKKKWDRYMNLVQKDYGYAPGMKKNSLFISSILYKAWEDDTFSESLKSVCYKILDNNNFVPFYCPT